MANLRSHERLPWTGDVEIWWFEDCEFTSVHAFCRDISEAGAGIHCACAFNVGKRVQIGPVGTSKTACVRYCRWDAKAFAVGFEFTPLPAAKPIWKYSELKLAMRGVNW